MEKSSPPGPPSGPGVEVLSICLWLPAWLQQERLITLLLYHTTLTNTVPLAWDLMGPSEPWPSPDSQHRFGKPLSGLFSTESSLHCSMYNFYSVISVGFLLTFHLYSTHAALAALRVTSACPVRKGRSTRRRDGYAQHASTEDTAEWKEQRM